MFATKSTKLMSGNVEWGEGSGMFGAGTRYLVFCPPADITAAASSRALKKDAQLTHLFAKWNSLLSWLYMYFELDESI